MATVYNSCPNCSATWLVSEPEKHEAGCLQHGLAATQHPYPALTGLLARAVSGEKLTQPQANLLHMMEQAIRLLPSVEASGVKPSELSMLRALLGRR